LDIYFFLFNCYIINPVLGKPMKTLQKEQKCEHCNKLWTKIVTKHSECQTCFSYCVPTSLKQVLWIDQNSIKKKTNNRYRILRIYLKLNWSQLSKENLVNNLADQESNNERLQVQHGHARIRLGQINNGWIELFFVKERI